MPYENLILGFFAHRLANEWIIHRIFSSSPVYQNLTEKKITSVLFKEKKSPGKTTHRCNRIPFMAL